MGDAGLVLADTLKKGPPAGDLSILWAALLVVGKVIAESVVVRGTIDGRSHGRKVQLCTGAKGHGELYHCRETVEVLAVHHRVDRGEDENRCATRARRPRTVLRRLFQGRRRHQAKTICQSIRGVPAEVLSEMVGTSNTMKTEQYNFSFSDDCGVCREPYDMTWFDHDLDKFVCDECSSHLAFAAAALLGSIPRMRDSRERLTAIDGQPPDLAALPPGCAFAPRCPSAFERCGEPPPQISRDDRTVRCWLAEGGADARDPDVEGTRRW